MVQTYDVRDVNLVVDGRVITGFAEGSAITIEKLEDNFEPHVGVKGEVSVAESNHPLAQITCIIQNTSPSNAELDALSNKRNEDALVPAEVIDLSTNGVSSGGSQARVTKPADKEYSNEITEREYVITVFDFEVDA